MHFSGGVGVGQVTVHRDDVVGLVVEVRRA